jgi:succinate dehydrogenase / fumarate reductase cytochrome b subunit
MAYSPSVSSLSRWTRIVLAYKRHSGSWAWILHRATGLGLTAYLFMHIMALSGLQRGQAAFMEEMAMFSTPVFKVLEWVLSIGVFFHAFNGVRIVLVDFGRGAHYHKAILPAVYILSIAFIALMGWLILR